MFRSHSTNQLLKSNASPPPSIRINIGRPAYRPGELLIASIDVHNEQHMPKSQQRTPNGSAQSSFVADLQKAVLVKEVTVEVRGVERVDPTWIITPKNTGSGIRGERVILTSEATPLASNLVLKPGGTKTWSIRATLPKVLPPSYRGTALRYAYVVCVTVTYGPVVLAAEETASASQLKQSIPPVVERVPFRVWSLPGSSGLAEEQHEGSELNEEGGIVPITPVSIDIHCREKTARSNWIAATEALSGGEEEDGEQPPREIEVPAKTPTLRATSLPLDRTPFVPSSPVADVQVPLLSLPHGSRSVPASRTQSNGAELADAPPTSRSSTSPSDLERASSLDLRSLGSSEALPATEQLGRAGFLQRTESDDLPSPLASPLLSSMARGRTYNIRIGDQLLVRFSPRNPEPVYTLGDAVSGTLDFSDYQPGERRCLKVSVMLETQEIIASSALHPSRRNPSGSQIIPKVQTEYHELAADLIHTHFIFTIPGDAPQSFSTPLVTIQWTLRFEFLASSGGDNVKDRIERAEWAMPVLVHAPIPERAPVATKRRKGARKEREGGYQPLSPGRRSAIASPKRLHFGHASDERLDESEQEREPS